MNDVTNFDKLLNDDVTPVVTTSEDEARTIEDALDMEPAPSADLSILDQAQKTPSAIEKGGLFTSYATKARGIDEDVATDLCEEDDKQDEWTHFIARNKKGMIDKSMYNINLIMTHDVRLKGVLAFNEFTHQICQVRSIKPGLAGTDDLIVEDEVNGDALDDQQVDVIRAIFSAPGEIGGYDLSVTESDVRAGMRSLARKNAFHPVKRYLNSLKWDGVKRVESFFIDVCGAEDNAYTREVAFLTMLAAVTRICEPGHKFDFIPILESGVQGFGKSTLVRTLAEGFFAELLGEDMSDTTRAREKMMGAWILEVPELTAMKGRDAGKLKAFLSAQTDKARMAYDRGATEVKRQAIFIGTIDRSEYLDDPAGNRRYWPIKCGTKPIELAALKKNVSQIWAEAVLIYKNERKSNPRGDLPLYLSDPKSKAISKKMQKSRMISSPDEDWKDDIRELASGVEKFEQEFFCEKMHERCQMKDGSDGMRIKFFSLHYAWTRIGHDAVDWNSRTQVRFAAAIAHIPGIEKGESPQKKDLPHHSEPDGRPGLAKKQRYYVIDHKVLTPASCS